jgi:tetratricopeptide (TPR) repeat protein
MAYKFRLLLFSIIVFCFIICDSIAQYDIDSLHTKGKQLAKSGNPKGGLEILSQCVALTHESGASEIKSRVRISYGKILELMHNDSLALIYHREALKIADQIKNVELLTKQYLNLGHVLNRQQKYSESLDNYLKAKYLSEYSNNTSFLIQSERNCGVLFFKLGEIKKSDNAFDRALRLAKKQKDKKLTAEILNSMALNFIDNEEYETASKILSENTKVFKESKQLNFLASLYLSLGITLAKQLDLTGADSLANETIHLAKQKKYYELEARAYMLQAQVLNKSSNYKEALNKINSAEEIFSKHNYKEGMLDAYKAKLLVLKKFKTDDVYEYIEKYIELDRQLDSIEIESSIQKTLMIEEAKSINNKLIREIEKKDKTISNFQYIISIGSILIISIGIILFILFRQKSRTIAREKELNGFLILENKKYKQIKTETRVVANLLKDGSISKLWEFYQKILRFGDYPDSISFVRDITSDYVSIHKSLFDTVSWIYSLTNTESTLMFPSNFQYQSPDLFSWDQPTDPDIVAIKVVYTAVGQNNWKTLYEGPNTDHAQKEIDEEDIEIKGSAQTTGGGWGLYGPIENLSL